MPNTHALRFSLCQSVNDTQRGTQPTVDGRTLRSPARSCSLNEWSHSHFVYAVTVTSLHSATHTHSSRVCRDRRIPNSTSWVSGDPRIEAVFVLVISEWFSVRLLCFLFLSREVWTSGLGKFTSGNMSKMTPLWQLKDSVMRKGGEARNYISMNR